MQARGDEETRTPEDVLVKTPRENSLDMIYMLGGVSRLKLLRKTQKDICFF